MWILASHQSYPQKSRLDKTLLRAMVELKVEMVIHFPFLLSHYLWRCSFGADSYDSYYEYWRICPPSTTIIGMAHDRSNGGGNRLAPRAVEVLEQSIISNESIKLVANFIQIPMSTDRECKMTGTSLDAKVWVLSTHILQRNAKGFLSFVQLPLQPHLQSFHTANRKMQAKQDRSQHWNFACAISKRWFKLQCSTLGFPQPI